MNDNDLDAHYDAAAMGEMLPWALGQLRNRLGPVLEHAGADSLHAEVNPAAIEGTLDEVEALARSAQAELAAQRAQ